MTLITQTILAADDELRYPTSGELKSIKSFLEETERKLDTISILVKNEKSIIEQASRRLWQKHPEYISPGGNAYGSRQRALCLRDYGWYLRLLTYAILAGDKDPIEKIGVIGAREMYNNLGVPVKGMADAIRSFKEAAAIILPVSTFEEVEPYADYLIQSFV
uniref:Allophycocyanin gamma subunit n=1 Tax=Gloeochaete wittrockiana TaxID=38269 RepID=A0A3G1IW40_9EUKA|nr:allophycocyanin gamma subunit [Gloeochaete wittrockiana]ASQ40251.1 allophycocyanin gamma subunit [Gloeochaete wittrockiana]